jgi:F-type H+-transporting ATPase subunit a
MNQYIYLFSMRNPLDQFEIRDYIMLDVFIFGNYHISLTNMVEYLLKAFIIIIAMHLIVNKWTGIVYKYWLLMKETLYDTIKGIVVSQINDKTGQIYFPFIYVLFLFILINNLISLVPYSFATTSHFVLTFALSFTVVIGSTLLGLVKNKTEFFALFVPAGCPLGLVPLLVLIEFLSYLARNLSLGLRLAANIFSGHMLLNILSGLTYNIMTTNWIYFIVGILPLSFIVAFSSLEVGIAFIQAQVFVVLTCSYIKDGLDLH